MLDNAMLKDVASKKMATPAAKREAVAHLRTSFEVSERRACTQPRLAPPIGRRRRMKLQWQVT
jgi:hypothetical protein